jgi:[protein-PII] uridylyltransferase
MSRPAGALAPALYDPAETAAVLAREGVTPHTCKALHAQLRERLRARYDAGPCGTPIVAARTALVDDLLHAAWQSLGAQHADAGTLALVAVGGYGRGQLHPYSDVDVLILAPRASHVRRADAFVRAFVTFLWDAGLEVGHSARSLAQCAAEARADLSVATNAVEARLLCGSPGLFDDLRTRIAPARVWSVPRFFAAKLAEQRARYAKFGETAYRLEPNVKESPGGLRDIHTVGWVAKRHFGGNSLEELLAHGFLEPTEYAALRDGYEFLTEVRNGLHLLAVRKEDHLTFERQRELARRYGYQDGPLGLAVEQFMKRYYRTVMELSRLNEMLLAHFEEEILLARRADTPVALSRRFQVRKGYLEAAHPRVFQRYPFALLELFLLLEQHPELRGVRADTIRLLRAHLPLIDDAFREDLRCTTLFMEIIRQPRGVGHELQRMHRYGVLARYLPSFGRVVGQMQHDLFHVYTVDEHSLIVLRNTRSFAFPREKVPALALGYEVFARLPKPELLYLAALFHDIGKGQGGDHSEIGAREAEAFCRRHRLSEYDTRLVAWLVRHHLVMSRVSQREDIADPDVVSAFAVRVGDQVHLDYLYLLTIADMRGTSPTVWNSWKGSLLTTLYLATRRALGRGLGEPLELDAQLEEVRRSACTLLPAEQVTTAQAEALWRRFDADYFLRFTAPEIAWHARNLCQADSAERLIVATRNFPERGGTGALVYTPDRANLFAAITATLDRLDLDIVDARIYTTADGWALDNFIVLELDGRPVTDPACRLATLAALLAALAPDVLAPQAPSRRIPRARKAFEVPTEVSCYTDARGRSVLELITTDRPGLLSRVALALARAGVRLDGARINTFGERAEDVFIVAGADGRPVTEPAALAALRAAVMQAVGDPAAQAVA